MASGFKINKDAIRKMSREIEREFARNPVHVPLHVDPSDAVLPSATTVNNYNGPVVTVVGNRAQLAWENERVTQTQRSVEEIATGYEALAQIVTDLLANLPKFALEEGDETLVRESADAILAEVVKPEPDESILRRATTMLKGIVAPIAAGLNKAMTEETTEAARGVIDAITGAIPS